MASIRENSGGITTKLSDPAHAGWRSHPTFSNAPRTWRGVRLERVVRAQRETFMTPAKIEYEIGSTIYGQPLRLVRSKSSSGQMEWILARDQADQRDDSAVIAGLTRDHILKMAEAVKAHVP